MNEQELRSLVREAVERHLGRPFEKRSTAPFSAPARVISDSAHPSHLVLNVVTGGDDADGMCVVEPTVRCNHCRFCQSYGH
jgi:hypothetical protein